MSNPLLETVREHKAGAPVGVYSVCSAHPLVLEAAMLQAREDDTYVLVEATSNQVDQFGGYTGLTPAQFRDLVHRIATEQGLPRERVVLGGDHLGPNRWRALPADEAMTKADALVAAYAAAGYVKIHLDCSMACADDTTPLTDAVVAERAARLAAVADEAAARAGTARPVYVVGTEVPVPGGAHETLGEIVPTAPDAARATIEAHRAAFAARGIAEAWERVIALVVQPGVEFDHVQVVPYDRSKTTELRRVLDTEPTMVFEAHSTDYQTADRLAALVQDHWAILKVGPGLTFALREALFALAHVEAELLPEAKRSWLREVVEERMTASPEQWAGYYEGDDVTRRLARRYSFSDRLRYYWPDPEIEAAQERLLANLAAVTIPLPLISQYLPRQYDRVAAGDLAADPRSLVVDRVRDALRPYAHACLSTKERS